MSHDVLSKQLCEVINILYLHFQNTYRHQTGQDGDLLWEAPIFKDKWAFGYVTNVWSGKKKVISAFTR